MQEQPLISIVMPSYNQAAYLEQALRSVLLQDYPTRELLVLDGGSTDGSADIIRKYQGQLAFWRSEKDKGQADAIARGFEKSQGSLLGWLNSDDVLLPGALSAVAGYFQKHPEKNAVSGGAFCIGPDGAPAEFGFVNYTRGVAASHSRLKFYGQEGMYQPACFWRRDAYFACDGVDPSFRFIMDWDLFQRLAGMGSWGRLPRFLACYRVHGQTKTSLLKDVHQQEAVLLARKNGLDQVMPLERWLLYWRHRCLDLCRKFWLRALKALGLARLKPVEW